ncbi:MAG TPA: protein translocase subunit SecD [Gammaproteobacteria bacterium]|jgi:preprotein translocase subunit SecD|nr:protein translocase subunit SecD [Gammaproteobacteria bacterium]
MNRYPLWKNLLVFGIVFVAMILALPNLFGEDEAVQVSRADGVAVDQTTITQIRTALMEKNIPFLSIEQNGPAALVRFETVEQQLRANDALRDALPNNVAALTTSSRTPAWLRAVGLKPMSLGLDLRGGVHFLYQVDLNAAVNQFLQTYESDLRQQFRQGNIRNDIRIADGVLRIAIVEPGDMDRAEAMIRKLETGDQLVQLGQLTSRLIIDRGDVDGRPGFLVRLTPAAIKERQDFAIQQNTLTLRNRVNAIGVSEAVVQRQGLDRILVELPGVQDPGQAKRVLGSTATLEFHLVDMENNAFDAERRGRAPIGSELQKTKDGTPILLRRDVIASGGNLIDAVSNPSNGQPAVQVRLDAAGARKMLDTTINNLGRNMAVLFIEDQPQLVERDGKMVPGPPKRKETVINNARINGVFSNRFEITGLTVFEARDLSLLLRAGSLAAPIVPVEERTIGPSLGQDNIDRGIRATIIGYLLVVLWISFYYRLMGILANIALLANVVMLVSVMSLFSFVLTLPGIAGIVLTMGMAIDANVLIYERIREELRNGSTPQASIRAGFDKAYSTIVDANLTTLIAGIVLFMFGTGPIKGFAVTLSIGIVTSMFTAITVTRALVNLAYGGKTNLKSISVGGGPYTASSAKAPAAT